MGTARKSLIATLAMAQNLTLREQFSFWSQAEQERMEEHRQDPDEAHREMEQRLHGVQQKFREEQKQMNERVWNAHALNIRPRSEWEEIEAARRDPQEAAAEMTQKV